MQTKIMTLFTRTPLHVGCGSSVGAVDQPVVRERHTGFPVIPGSAIKGVLADLWNERKDKEIVRSEEGRLLFGNDDTANAAAGKLLVGEGRLLAFPVRSAKGAFAWLTCPLALNRFRRDGGAAFAVPEVSGEEVLLTAESGLKFVESGKVIFEEYPLTVSGTIGEDLFAALSGLCMDDIWAELKNRLAIVSDELFQYFAENACEIANHNRIDDEKGVVAQGALFNQENVPSETLFYGVMNAKDGAHLDLLADRLNKAGNLLQVGADATTGLGWCSVALKEVK